MNLYLPTHQIIQQSHRWSSGIEVSESIVDGKKVTECYNHGLMTTLLSKRHVRSTTIPHPDINGGSSLWLKMVKSVSPSQRRQAVHSTR